MWMDQLGGNEVYLSLLLNIIKYNSSHLSKETLQGIVKHLCEHCSTSSSTTETESLLKVNIFILHCLVTGLDAA